MGLTRQDLIQGAVDVLNETNSMDGLTVDALAARLRMSKSTLYKHFEGLEDLIYNVAEHVCNAVEDEMVQVSGTNPEEVFTATSTVYANYSSRVPVPFIVNRHRVHAKARLRLENFEERINSRMFQAALALGATSSVAYGIRSAYDGLLRFTAKIPAEEKADRFTTLANVLQKGLK